MLLIRQLRKGLRDGNNISAMWWPEERSFRAVVGAEAWFDWVQEKKKWEDTLETASTDSFLKEFCCKRTEIEQQLEKKQWSQEDAICCYCCKMKK